MLRNMCLLLRTRNEAYRLLYDFLAILLIVQILPYCSETSLMILAVCNQTAIYCEL